jgi:hypothetical protein|tara:strand:- start:2993 stop:3610 length:618 start_codon:yes stop_codon:yes gene_type:complete
MEIIDLLLANEYLLTVKALATKFWMWTVLITLIIVGFIINLFDKKKTDGRVNFKYTDYPHMKPIRIATKGKGFFAMIKMWLLGVRHWEITTDFSFSVEGKKFIIPAGFKFDGASIPKFLHMFLSPVGVLLIGGLVHDYAYKYETLLRSNKKDTMGKLSQKRADQIFRDINIEVNGFFLMNYLAYWSLRLGGFMAWNKHRKNGAKI